VASDEAPKLKDGIAAYRDGRYAQAATCLEQALDKAQAEKSQMHLLYTLNLWLGEINLALAHLAQAEKLWAGADACEQKKLEDNGSSDLDLESLGARLLALQDKHDESEAAAKALLVQAKEIFGSESLPAASSFNTLGVVLDQAGKTQEATVVLRRALSIRERILGTDSLPYAQSLTNLALNYARENNVTSAEALCKRALAVREKHLREAHPLIGYSLHHLAAQILRQGHADQSYDYFSRALRIFEKELPENHPQIGSTLNGLGSAAIAMKRFDQAQELFERALKIAEAEERRSDINILSAASGLGLAYLSQNQFSKAEPHIKRALRLVEDSHQLQAAAEKGLLDRLMVCYVLQGKFVDAIRLYPDSMRASHTSDFETVIELFKMVGKLAQRHLGPKDDA
jgi:tetratricopeptide (TPR) repeat protein